MLVRFLRTVYASGYPVYEAGREYPVTSDTEKWVRRGAARYVEQQDANASARDASRNAPAPARDERPNALAAASDVPARPDDSQASSLEGQPDLLVSDEAGAQPHGSQTRHGTKRRAGHAR